MDGHSGHKSDPSVAVLTPAAKGLTPVLVNKNWTQILNFFTAKIGFLCNATDVLIHPCLVGWSVSGME